jgi:uncharacterized protein (DUF1778 family)
MDYVVKRVPRSLLRAMRAAAKARGETISDFTKRAVREQNAHYLRTMPMKVLRRIQAEALAEGSLGTVKRIQAEVQRRIKAAAKASGHSVAEFARQAVDEHVIRHIRTMSIDGLRQLRIDAKRRRLSSLARMIGTELNRRTARSNIFRCDGKSVTKKPTRKEIVC